MYRYVKDNQCLVFGGRRVADLIGSPVECREHGRRLALVGELAEHIERAQELLPHDKHPKWRLRAKQLLNAVAGRLCEFVEPDGGRCELGQMNGVYCERHYQRVNRRRHSHTWQKKEEAVVAVAD